MAEITAALVKDLRERTGAGMMECKKALTETNGDIEAAIEHMRKAGMAKADKKAGRTAAEGLIIVKAAADGKRLVMVEVNCETDFVTKGDDFRNFANAVGEVALNSGANDIDALLAAKMPDGMTVADATKALIAKIGENSAVRRMVAYNSDNILVNYLHGTRIGVVVELQGGTAELARDIAMHVAASRPQCVSEDQVPAELIEKEREIYTAQSADSGKPADIIAKMVDGRIKKFLKEVTLLGQPFVKNPDISVEKLVKDAGAKVIGFTRFEVGEGIEKKTVNFAEEVAAQAAATSK
ncbi:translation elongation factor Ts [Sulfurivermis fontis]|uniref:translation elongation factor Ts n=1 Tax=Sulfurivermis fontis TaxID=1972068 RepID=UPI000FD7C6C8|nr:translation elongation factor Ts [Sulfurivermis fontis]